MDLCGAEDAQIILQDDYADLDLINKLLRTPMAFERQGAQLLEHLRCFVDVNADPGLSPNYEAGGGDDMTCLLHLLGRRNVLEDQRFVMAGLQALKILLRKERNRVTLDEVGARVVCDILRAPGTGVVAREVSNVLLNMCYEAINVARVVQLGGVGFLLAYLENPDDDLVASALGALQSICFTPIGRQTVRDVGAVPLVVQLLKSENVRVCTRAVGTLHNVSSDSPSIVLLREAGALPQLVAALRAPVPAICSSAAGALQNMSREQVSRETIRDLGAVGPLSDLLVGSDMQAQVCAAGALLNVVGPELGDEEDVDCPARVQFRKMLSDSIAMAAVYHVVFEDRTKPFLEPLDLDGQGAPCSPL